MAPAVSDDDPRLPLVVDQHVVPPQTLEFVRARGAEDAHDEDSSTLLGGVVLADEPRTPTVLLGEAASELREAETEFPGCAGNSSPSPRS